ncbi:MAG: hypothetical protein B7Y56_12625 [Gallionellales bacterium 35-53-114]|jgi:surface carbohydrate biosynthesis protein|nr:MAG: hypothetical protein B7Y56_12625 [Gallionellales bacterium 35-53-114]OYZ63447.1 MAG: hypothetical protein B7Y04_08835 [Gallionellales bacterium 24-53-125]OZB10940.1 MAG: hypothetical protein B7X61_00855 [Gallionellales bacterium 39-52-133]HQS58877.1 hypothetical protein [Gallionellaceae bacterium]HQS75738.1 hypothetical protein [Gallionellaceae bacterium]
MRFSNLKAKIIFFYTIFIFPPKQWKLPKKSQILVYESVGLEALEEYLVKYSFEVIPLRGEHVNVPCLLISTLKKSFWKGNPIQAYVDTFIQIVSPKIVITFIDNNAAFYTISNRFPDIKTIFLQNGLRSKLGDIFGALVKSDTYHVDYMLVHGEAIGRLYRDYISGEVIAVGSLKNNKRVGAAGATTNSILFISQYHEKPKEGMPFWTEPDGTKILWEQFFAAEIQLLKILGKWCEKNNRLLKICGRETEEIGTERLFYAENLSGFNWEYIPMSYMHSSYELVDVSDIVVSIDSTLGYEALGRGKKTAIFPCRGKYLNNEDTKFGWPAAFPENGPFWSNWADAIQTQRVMDYLNMVSSNEWNEIRQPYTDEIMKYDPGNTRFVELLKQLLPKSESFNHA